MAEKLHERLLVGPLSKEQRGAVVPENLESLMAETRLLSSSVKPPDIALIERRSDH